jgi:tetratricopeptide (TPR) repeat protein
MWILGCGLAALALLGLALPFLISSIYLAAGSRVLESSAPSDRAAAARAASRLEQARRWAPDDISIDRALARAYQRLDQPQAAIIALERAYRLRPESPLIQQELAEAYEAAGQLQRAAGLWVALGVPANRLLELGEQERKAKRYAAAQVWYRRAGYATPGSIQPLLYAGRAYREEQRLEQSLEMLGRAVELAPGDRDGWYELGLTQAARKEWQLALATYRRALDAPKGKVGRSVLYVQIGFIQQYLLTPRDLDQAWAAYEQALALGDYRAAAQTQVTLFYQRGVILASRKQWADAADSYRQALLLNDGHYNARVALAEAQWQLGQREAAKDTARDAIERNPSAKEAYRRLGRFYQEEGNTTTAREMYSQILALDPKDAAARKALNALP